MAALTDTDRWHIAQARALAALSDNDEIRAYLADRGLAEPGEFEGREVYPFAFGVARSMLESLAAIAESLAD